MAPQRHVLVIGAGVIGLQTAISLIEAGYLVTIVAKHIPGDLSQEYTSPWAGAIWRSNALPHETEMQAWDKESYKIWLEKTNTDKTEAKKAGIMRVPMRLLWTGPHEFIPNGPMSIWYANEVRSFQEIPESELSPSFTSGATHDGIAVNAPLYLQSLLCKFKSLNGRIIKATIPTDNETGLAEALLAAERLVAHEHNISEPITAFVNATGLGARTLVPDPAVHPIRGQTVTVRGLARGITTMFYPDANASVAPRLGSGVSILGSTYQENNWDPAPDPVITARILERCKPFAPELLDAEGEFNVISVNVGFRPGRTGGPRIKVEEVRTESGVRLVCHNYGNAGGGFQNSFGSARKVVDLLGEKLKERMSGGGRGGKAKL